MADGRVGGPGHRKVDRLVRAGHDLVHRQATAGAQDAAELAVEGPLSAMFIVECWVQTVSYVPSANGRSSASPWWNSTCSRKPVRRVRSAPTRQNSSVRSTTVTRQPNSAASTRAGPNSAA